MKQHSDSHNCHICNKPFGSQELLIGHMTRCHVGDKPFKCEVSFEFVLIEETIKK